MCATLAAFENTGGVDKKPAHLPVQQSTKVQMFLNLKTAKALGIQQATRTVPIVFAQVVDPVSSHAYSTHGLRFLRARRQRPCRHRAAENAFRLRRSATRSGNLSV